MRKISIGRAPECDVQIKDDSERVSRRHAIITFTPTGKMTIYDTSSNGTFVNGEKVKKPNGIPVKRGDQINFGHAADLDWDTIQDPYRKTRIVWLILFIVIALAIAACIVLAFSIKDTEEEQVFSEPAKTEQADSVASKESSHSKTSKEKKQKEKEEESKEISDKENEKGKPAPKPKKSTDSSPATPQTVDNQPNGTPESNVTPNPVKEQTMPQAPRVDDTREREKLRKEMQSK